MGIIYTLVIFFVVTFFVNVNANFQDGKSYQDLISDITQFNTESEDEPCPGMYIIANYDSYTQQMVYTADIYGTRIPILSPNSIQLKTEPHSTGVYSAPVYASLGEGAHGAITEAIYTPNNHDKNNQVIAIKHVPYTVMAKDYVCHILEETSIMYSLYTNTSHKFSNIMVPVLGLIDAYSLSIPMAKDIQTIFSERLNYSLMPRNKDNKDSLVPSKKSILRTPLALVMEKMDCTVTEYIHYNGCRKAAMYKYSSSPSRNERRNRLFPPSSYVSSSSSLFTRLRILSEIAYGLMILHNDVGAAHGDIKGINILMNKFGSPVFTDFGRYTVRSISNQRNIDNSNLSPYYKHHHYYSSLSMTSKYRPSSFANICNYPVHIDRTFYNISKSSNIQAYIRSHSTISKVSLGDGNVYTDGYAAPETLYDPILNGPSIATASTDIFAFAVTMWELLVKYIPKYGPFFHLPNYKVLDTAIMAGVRPLLNKELMIDNLPHEMIHLMQLMWLHNRELRPNSTEIYYTLQSIMNKMEYGKK